MKHLNLIAGLGLALAMATGARAEHPPSQMLEEAIESNAELITLPSSITGTVAVRDCAACAARTLRLSPTTRFFIGGRPVTLQELDAHLRSGHAAAMIFYNVGDGLVSRVTAGP